MREALIRSLPHEWRARAARMRAQIERDEYPEWGLPYIWALEELASELDKALR